MKHLLVIAAALGIGLALRVAIAPAPASAQAPRSRSLQRGELAQIVGIKPGDVSLTARAYPVIRLRSTEFAVLDVDGSGDTSINDTAAGWGDILDTNGQVMGEWRMSTTYISDNSAAGVGQLMLAFSNGSISIPIGWAHSGGIRSGVPSLPINGGTGSFAKLTGNAGLGVSGNDLLIQIGVK